MDEHLQQVNTYIEIGSAFGMLTLTIGTLSYIILSKTRVQSYTNVFILLSLIISFASAATLSIFDLEQ